MPSRIPIILCTALILLVFGCSSDSTDPVVTGDSATGDYLKSLPTWDEFSPPLDRSVVDTGEPTSCIDVVENQRFICVETPKSLTDTPDDVVTFNAGSDILWPGALIQGATYVGGLGTMQELGIRQRAPLVLSIDILDQNNTRTVTDPTLATVRSAVGEMIAAATAANHQAGNRFSYKKTVAHSMEQLALDMGLSVKFMGASIRTDLSYDTSTETNTVAAYFVQNMFTVAMVQPQTPEAIFSNAFTREILQEQIDLGRVGPGNLPVYVSQVVYGRMLVMTMTSAHTASEMMVALTASYAAVEVNGEVTDTSVFEESVFTVAAVGGGETGVMGLLGTGDLASYFDQTTELTEAVPISYTLRNLGDNSVASVSETTTYVERICSSVEVRLLGMEAGWRNAVLGELGDEIFTFVPSADNLALSQ